MSLCHAVLRGLGVCVALSHWETKSMCVCVCASACGMIGRVHKVWCYIVVFSECGEITSTTVIVSECQVHLCH